MQIKFNYADETRFTVKPDKELQRLKNCQDSNAALFNTIFLFFFNTIRLQLIFIKVVIFFCMFELCFTYSSVAMRVLELWISRYFILHSTERRDEIKNRQTMTQFDFKLKIAPAVKRAVSLGWLGFL